EGQKAYIIVNAIGAVVLLVFLQAIWPSPGALLLKKGVLWGIIAFGAGVAVATLGYAVRLWTLRRSGPRFIAPVVSLVNGLIPLLVVGSFLAGVILPVRAALTRCHRRQPTGLRRRKRHRGTRAGT